MKNNFALVYSSGQKCANRSLTIWETNIFTIAVLI